MRARVSSRAIVATRSRTTRRGHPGPHHRKKGYATETARALMDWAATEHGIRRFVSSTTPNNAPSLRVHDKLGFARTGQVVDGEIIFELRR